MPIYTYKCPVCDKVEDILHQMSEIDNPSKEIQIKTSCNETNCPCMNSNNEDCGDKVPVLGTPWKRQITAPHLANMKGGTTVTEKTLLKDKQKQRSERGKIHFKNEIMPKLNESDQQRFKKKLSHIDEKKKIK